MAHRLAVEPTGVLTIRAWRDLGQFRARIRWTRDIEHEDETVELCDSEEQVHLVVRHWLAGLPGSGDRNT
jgi:hypothetical protein